MAGAGGIFVSKRVRHPAMALLCLTLIQLLFVLADCEGEHVPMAARQAASAR